MTMAQGAVGWFLGVVLAAGCDNEADSYYGSTVGMNFQCSTVATKHTNCILKLSATEVSTEVGCLKKICRKGCGSCNWNWGGPCALSDLPSSCTPSVLRARGETCVYPFQCASGFCCPYLRICLKSATDGIINADIKDEDVRKQLMKGGNDQTCGLAQVKANTNACNCQTTGPNGEKGYPCITDVNVSKCGCQDFFLKRYAAGTWIPGCGGGMTAPGTATTTTTTATKLPPMRIIGGLTMSVPDPDKFLSDTVAKDAVRTGIADAHTVTASSVTLKVEKVARRLALVSMAEEFTRRLAGAVKIGYTIAVGANKTQQEDIKKLANSVTATQLNTAIQKEVMVKKGSDYAIAVTAKAAPNVEYGVVTETNTQINKGTAGASVAARSTCTLGLVAAFSMFTVHRLR